MSQLLLTSQYLHHHCHLFLLQIQRGSKTNRLCLQSFDNNSTADLPGYNADLLDSIMPSFKAPHCSSKVSSTALQGLTEGSSGSRIGLQSLAEGSRGSCTALQGPPLRSTECGFSFSLCSLKLHSGSKFLSPERSTVDLHVSLEGPLHSAADLQKRSSEGPLHFVADLQTGSLVGPLHFVGDLQTGSPEGPLCTGTDLQGSLSASADLQGCFASATASCQAGFPMGAPSTTATASYQTSVSAVISLLGPFLAIVGLLGPCSIVAVPVHVCQFASLLQLRAYSLPPAAPDFLSD
ncbi:hypothetical protein AMECASPLE_019893 [Ameca splendens]|uniref:Uncharacterized protein n=1 Tax=Ameca splendens TaxID=208324 RepID=A0ABV0ZCW7_9TELE